MTNNQIAIWTSPQELSINSNAPLAEIIKSNQQLKPKEISKVIHTFSQEMYDVSAEYIWLRTMNILREKVLSLGEDFVSEMLGRTNFESIDSINSIDIINLAADLGFINKAGRMKLLQTDEIIRYYSSRDAEEEMDRIDSERTITVCMSYVLSLDTDNYNFSYNNFRETLKEKLINDTDLIYSQLITSPYFYKRTTVRTLLNLIKITKSAEQEIVFANMQRIVPAIWKDLLSDDKWPIGFAYANAVNEGNRTVTGAIKSLLLKVKGFDFVPENLRSMTYSLAAEQLINAHNGLNNFYNEPSYAKRLLEMGSSIPTPAVNKCIEAVLACKIGTKYGVSWDAQESLNQLLETLTLERWQYYLNQSLPASPLILYKLAYGNKDMQERWIDIVINYHLQSPKLSNPIVNNLLESSASKNHHSLTRHAISLYETTIMHE